MPKLSYPLNAYIKAVNILASESKFDRVEYKETKGSIVRFEVFIPGENIPCSVWTIHHDHDKKKSIWSKEDHKKPSKHLGMPEGRFEDILKEL